MFSKLTFTKLKSITRRQFLKGSALFAATTAASVQAPYVFAKTRPTLRVLGTHVTLQEELRKRAQEELNIDLEFIPGGSAKVLQKATSDPSSFDLYEQWSDSINVLWRSDAIQPIETERLTYWDEINNLTKTGQIVEGAKIGAGDAPHKILFVQDDKILLDTTHATLNADAPMKQKAGAGCLMKSTKVKLRW